MRHYEIVCSGSIRIKASRFRPCWNAARHRDRIRRQGIGSRIGAGEAAGAHGPEACERHYACVNIGGNADPG